MDYRHPTRFEEDQDYYYQCLADKRIDYEVEAVAALSLVVKPAYAKSFASVLAWAYDQEDRDAMQLAKDIGLDEAHIYAVLKDEEHFEKIIRG